MGKWDATASRTLATIKRKGGIATFRSVGTDTSDTEIFDPITGLFAPAPGNTAQGIDVPAIQIPSDPDRYEANGMTLINSLSLMVAAGLVVPEPGMIVQWPKGSGKEYTVKYPEAVAPDGTPLLYLVDAQG